MRAEKVLATSAVADLAVRNVVRHVACAANPDVSLPRQPTRDGNVDPYDVEVISSSTGVDSLSDLRSRGRTMVTMVPTPGVLPMVSDPWRAACAREAEARPGSLAVSALGSTVRVTSLGHIVVPHPDPVVGHTRCVLVCVTVHD